MLLRRVLVTTMVTFLASSAIADEKSAPIRALLVTGGCCHDYNAQKEIIPEGVSARAPVEWTVVHQGGSSTGAKIELYEDPDWAEDYDVVVHNECFANVSDVDWLDRVLEPHRKGKPAVVVHCAMHCYRTGNDDWFEFLGVTSRRHGGHYAFEAISLAPKDPVMKTFGKSWTTPKGELYLIEKTWPNATPLAHAMSKDTKRHEVCVWKNLYGEKKTRVFGTTIGHHNETMAEDRYLDLVTRGLLWSVDRLDEKIIKKTSKKKRRKRKVPKNLARGKKATASSTQPGRPASDACDGNPSTRWCAANDGSPHWWQVDLGGPEDLIGCRILWEFAGRRYRYKIEGSADGKSWSTLIDRTRTNEKKQDVAHELSARGVRHIRVTTTGNERGAWVSFREFEAWGTGLEEIEVAPRLTTRSGSLLRHVKAPEDFDVTVYAAPTDIGYPTAICCAPTGEVFVSVDENSSLGRDVGRGKIVRCVDEDGDGRADRFTDFVPRIESPRGSFFDGETLYVIHQPYLSAFRDRDGDGVAEDSEVLVEGIGFPLEERPADHTSNAVRMGIDGWLYCAIGDFGFRRAVAKDGSTLQLHGGGVVRVRPDGTELELHAFGLRNIVDVTISPILDIFTRDNTNDGGGWDIRLSQIHQLAHYGYPSLFKRFGDEIMPPLAIYGGGSGCGALYLQEPGMPDGYGDALLTCDWGRNAIYLHELEPDGATYRPKQEVFVTVPRPTDLDVDGSSRLTIASWHGGQYRYQGPDIGFLMQLRHKGEKIRAYPDPRKATPIELVEHLRAASHVLRLDAQRELLRRKDAMTPNVVAAIREIAKNAPSPGSRVAAIFTLSQGLGERSHAFLTEMMKEPSAREHAMRALTDRRGRVKSLSADPFIAALSDKNPRVRRQALVSLARLGRPEAARAVLAQTSSDDAVIKHIATKTLVTLHAVDACVEELLSADAKHAPGAARALRELHDAKAVDQLIAALGRTKSATRQRTILATLIRLYHREADWNGRGWGTRPDTRGPYFKLAKWEASDRIEKTVRGALESADAPTAETILQDLERNRVSLGGTLPLLLDLARKNAGLTSMAVKRIAKEKKIRRPARDFLADAAKSETTDTDTRLAALESLRHHDPARLPGLFDAASTGDATSRASVYAFFLRAAANKKLKTGLRTALDARIQKAWESPKNLASLLRAVGETKLDRYSKHVADNLTHQDREVRDNALHAAARIGKTTTSPTGPARKGPFVGELKTADVSAKILRSKGDPGLGEQIFLLQRCGDCHTVSPKDTPKGPFLGGIAKRYSRKELIESVLEPSAKVAQGFATQVFVLKDGTVQPGFVTREAGDEVELRNEKGERSVIAKKDIAQRSTSEGSIMPKGLVDKLSLDELAVLISYLESLPGKDPAK